MKKGNRGAALAYTIMLMLIVFSVCTMVLTIMLARVTETDLYARNAERERVCAQIGEIFRETKGEHGDGAESKFFTTLETRGLDVTISGETWTVTSGKTTYRLAFSADGGNNTLTVSSAGGSEYLRVRLDSDGKITAWTKGAA